MAQGRLETDYKEPWKIRDIIRNKITGHPYLVIHVYQFRGTAVVDLEDDKDLEPALIILPRRYDEYAPDYQMNDDVKKNDEVVFTYKPAFL